MKEIINEENIKLVENYIKKLNIEKNKDIVDEFLNWILDNNIELNETEIVSLINNDSSFKDIISTIVNDNVNTKKYSAEKRRLIREFLNAFRFVTELNQFENGLLEEKNEDSDELDTFDNDLITACLSNSPKRLLTREEVNELCKQYQNGSIEARDTLMAHNYRLVLSIAKRYQNAGLDIEDLFQAGCEGLMSAVKKYDYKLGFAFSTYATWWIRQNIYRTIARESRTIRIPVNIHDDVLKLKKEIASYYVNNGEIPNKELLEKIVSIPESRFETAYNQLHLNIVSLNAPVVEIEDTELVDIIEDEDSAIGYSDSNIENKIFYEEINKLFENSSLTDREKDVIRYRLGFYDGKCYKLEEVGKIYGVTRERIRQIEDKGLRKLKRNFEFISLNRSLGLEQQNLYYR